jgi:hypothetical protein
MSVNDEWENFKRYNDAEDDEIDEDEVENQLYLNTYNSEKDMIFDNSNSNIPKASNIYISTKTKIAYLSSFVDLKNVFWSIPVIPYSEPSNGVVKKQIKLNSITVEELDLIKSKLVNEPFYEEYVMTSIDNPNGRIKFKDIRKISIGVSKKDIMSYRCKRKSAFYNCFVLILRLRVDNIFKEFHIKVFNTGKIEIPGVQKEEVFQRVLVMIINILQPYIQETIYYKPDSEETVLINSNFNCGFFINREVLYDILKLKYNIQSIYDPCSYPGIQCKFYYNPDIDIQTGSQISEGNKELYLNVKEVSFMIFRTGSVLIVGKCDEEVLFIIYEFLKIVLNNEYVKICQKNIVANNDNIKDKKKKIRKKNITVIT